MLRTWQSWGMGSWIRATLRGGTELACQTGIIKSFHHFRSAWFYLDWNLTPTIPTRILTIIINYSYN
ncbi:MAG: hypothetical protein GX207_09235 [Peptococcaceae bacterium]|nr:hypothetical protein [Peptococcaceae bacterium]